MWRSAALAVARDLGEGRISKDLTAQIGEGTGALPPREGQGVPGHAKWTACPGGPSGARLISRGLLQGQAGQCRPGVWGKRGAEAADQSGDRRLG